MATDDLPPFTGIELYTETWTTRIGPKSSLSPLSRAPPRSPRRPGTSRQNMTGADANVSRRRRKSRKADQRRLGQCVWLKFTLVSRLGTPSWNIAIDTSPCGYSGPRPPIPPMPSMNVFRGNHFREGLQCRQSS